MSTPETFLAYYVDAEHSGSYKEVPFTFLPDHEVLIRVRYSSLNYKDALSATGRNNVTRSYPHIPGIDAAGEVVSDTSGTFNSGQVVLVTGYDLGTNTSGGFGEYIRVPAEWVVSLPSSMSLEQAMVFGTAGFTAVYGLKRLQRELITPERGPILVTGATGGVGSLAVFALSQTGFEVIAATRDTEAGDFLFDLGASEVISTESVTSIPESPLVSRKWAGSIDTVGGSILDAVLRQIDEEGAVACCGNILGKELQTNVYPFILRGVSLLGIDSAICKRALREEIWETISGFNQISLPHYFHQVCKPEDLEKKIAQILNGKVSGRVVVQHP